LKLKGNRAVKDIKSDVIKFFIYIIFDEKKIFVAYFQNFKGHFYSPILLSILYLSTKDQAFLGPFLFDDYLNLGGSLALL